MVFFDIFILQITNIRMVNCTFLGSYVIYSNRKIHPTTIVCIVFAELAERFSYYGMTLLVLYMIDKGAELVYEKSFAYAIYGAYGAMVYATPLLGGLIAEKFFGYRNSIMWGGILMALGHFTMAFPLISELGIGSPESIHALAEPMFFIALGLLILGNGFFKPNISSFVGTFYKQNSELRDRGFNLFYMGINIGAFLAPITCGAIGQDPNLGVNAWHYGFGLAGIGMVLGLLVFMYGLRTGVFKNNGHSPNPKLLNAKIAALRNEKGEYVGGGMTLKTATYVGTFLLIPVIFFLLSFGSKPLLYPWGKIKLFRYNTIQHGGLHDLLSKSIRKNNYKSWI